MNLFRIGMALNCIGMSLDDKSLEKVKGWLDEIEREVMTDNWIMCSDELPEENDEYLILWKCEGHKGIWYEIQEFYDGEWALNMPQAKGVEVIAWQPLPEKPKEALNV